MKRMKFRARLLAMSEADVLELVPTRVYASIKAENHTPVFKAFVVGQEGEARPRLVGIGSVIQQWFRSAIEALGNKLKLGTPVFNLHAPTNEHDGRTPIGEVIGMAVKNIEDALSAIAVVYIYPDYQDLPLDVASIEADVMVQADSKTQEVDDVDVLDVTGVALGNSAINTPAFPGATLLAAVQAFAGESKRTAGGSEMTLEELKKAVQEMKLKPSEVFDGKSLTTDPFIVEHVKEEKGSEYYARKRNQAEFEEEKAKWAKEKTDLESKVKGFTAAALKTRAADVLKVALTKRQRLDADEAFKKFLNRTYEKSFTPGDEAALERDVDKFIDDQVDEYKALIGEPGKDPKPGTKPAAKPDAGIPANDDGTDSEDDDPDEKIDPTKHPLIPS